MVTSLARARALIQEFKGNDYAYGIGCLGRTGEITALFGKRALLITRLQKRDPDSYREIVDSLAYSGCEIIGQSELIKKNSSSTKPLSQPKASLITL